VVPAHRAESTVRRTVESLLAQEPVDTRVIVVVDGELDGTKWTIADEVGERVRIAVNATAEGAARARNRGLALVETPFVMFVDADDFVEGRLIAGLVERMKSASADIGFGPMDLHDEWSGKRHSKFVPDFSSAEDVLSGWHVGNRYLSPCSVMWRTEFLRSIGGWDADLTRNDDGELVMRAILKGARFVNSNEGCGIYVKHSRDTLSNRTDNLPSLLLANDKLLAIESPSIERPVQVQACARHYFKIAWQCFYAGRDDLGRDALRRSRELGFSGTLGPLPFRIASALLGLRAAARLARYRRRLIGHPHGQVKRPA
jgi:glycosyltransferase involved in cell wall biosynthesis